MTNHNSLSPLSLAIKAAEDAAECLRNQACTRGWASPDATFGTWESRMRAVAQGWVETSEHSNAIVFACCQIADEALAADKPKRDAEAKAKGCINICPTWSETLDVYRDYHRSQPLTKLRDGFLEEMEKQFVKCGQVADRWLAKQLAAAT